MFDAPAPTDRRAFLGTIAALSAGAALRIDGSPAVAAPFRRWPPTWS